MAQANISLSDKTGCVSGILGWTAAGEVTTLLVTDGSITLVVVVVVAGDVVVLAPGVVMTVGVAGLITPLVSDGVVVVVGVVEVITFGLP